jgi:hypothetical protein
MDKLCKIAEFVKDPHAKDIEPTIEIQSSQEGNE